MGILKIITIISLAVNVLLGIIIISRDIHFKKCLKSRIALAHSSEQMQDNTMKDIVDKCLPENEPTMSELEEGSHYDIYDKFVFSLQEQSYKKDAFTTIGELLHSFEEFINNKSFKFIPLINYLGAFVRCMYWNYHPMNNYESFIEKKFPIEFPILNTQQSEELLSFLKDIRNGERKPESLVYLCNELMLNDDFDEALNKTKLIWH